MILYVLGELPADDALRVEAEYFADDEYLVELNAVCDEMVEAYLHGELPPAERARFAAQLEKLPYLNARVAAERALLHVLSTPPKTTAARLLAPAAPARSWRDSPARLSARLSAGLSARLFDWRLTLAAAGLLACGASVWLVWQARRTAAPPELAQQPAVSASPASTVGSTVGQVTPAPQSRSTSTPDAASRVSRRPARGGSSR